MKWMYVCARMFPTWLMNPPRQLAMEQQWRRQEEKEDYRTLEHFLFTFLPTFGKTERLWTGFGCTTSPVSWCSSVESAASWAFRLHGSRQKIHLSLSLYLSLSSLSLPFLLINLPHPTSPKVSLTIISLFQPQTNNSNISWQQIIAKICKINNLPFINSLK